MNGLLYQQVEPGLVNATWGGMIEDDLNCIHNFKVDYMKDPLGQFENDFSGAHKTIFVEKGPVEAGNLASVIIKVPLDTFMSFRLSASLKGQDGETVWMEGSVRNFKSNSANGCGSRDTSDQLGPGGPGTSTRWKPGFEDNDVEELLTFSLDEETEVVTVNWSKFNVTNKECLNGFVVQYLPMCDTCEEHHVGDDYDYSALVGPETFQSEFSVDMSKFKVSYYIAQC